MPISCIIPAWNGAEWIATCLQSVLGQTHPGDEVLVIDNGSTDGTPDRVAQDFPAVTLIRLTHNTGFAGGLNCGLRLAHGETLISINQDVVLRAGCLSALRQRLAAGPAVAGAKLLYGDERTIQHAGGRIIFPRCDPDHAGYRQIDEGQFDQARLADYVTGALFAFSRLILDTIGLFDEDFYPANYEEVDYCFRARAAGFPVWYEPQATAIHYESQTQDRRSQSYEQTMQRHRVRFAIKNLTSEQLRQQFFPAELAWLLEQPVSFTRTVMAPAYYRLLLSVCDPAWMMRSARWEHDRWQAVALAPAELATHLKALYLNAVRPAQAPTLALDERWYTAVNHFSL